MKVSLKKVVKSLLIVPALALALAVAAPVNVSAASDCDNITGGDISSGVECAKPTSAPGQLFGEGGVFVTVTNIMLFVIGAVAVIMLIVGGIRYVVSAGDQNAVTAAKNTILYAIIGLVVAFLAFAAVQFVSNQLSSSASLLTNLRR